jgi:hypothetical protein
VVLIPDVNRKSLSMKTNQVIELGNIVHTGNWNSPQRGRIYSVEGISPCLNTCGGGGLEPKILEMYENKETKGAV